MTTRQVFRSVLLLLVSSSAAVAGDCPSHPVTLVEFEVVSCARLDAANASHVVPFERLMRSRGVTKDYLDAQVAAVVAENAAVLLEVKTRRSRTIQVDDIRRWEMKPEAEAWKADAGDGWLVLRTKDPDACKRFKPKAAVVLAHPTDCSCDTGPTGWCAVSRDSIVMDVPADLAKFAR